MIINKSYNLVHEIFDDLISSKNRAIWLIGQSRRNKNIFLGCIAVIFIFSIYQTHNLNELLMNLFMVVFVSIFTFLIFTWSDTFWFLVLKSWRFKVLIKDNKTVKAILENIDKEDIKVDKNLEKTISSISQLNLEGYKPHAMRNGVEILILLGILLYTYPNFFILNIILFIVMLFYDLVYEPQWSLQVDNDIQILVQCIKNLYKKNPANCEEYIRHNNSKEIKELSEIYKVIHETRSN